jgi:hypothetical protein
VVRGASGNFVALDVKSRFPNKDDEGPHENYR